MKEQKQTTITAYGEGQNRYDYDGVGRLVVNDILYTDEQIAKLVAEFITIGLQQGLLIDTSVTTKEVPEDEEESYKVKFEKRNEEASRYYTEKTTAEKELKEQKEENAKLQAQVDAFLRICPDSHTKVDEDAEIERMQAEDEAMREARDKYEEESA